MIVAKGAVAAQHLFHDLLWRAKTDDLGNFPVKFPVCRENGQSRVRTPLRRQPSSAVSGEFISQALKRLANCGLFAMLKVSDLPLVELLAPYIPKSLYQS
jgi:hypothetical protein